MNSDLLRKIIEGALLAAGKPVDIARLEILFEEEGVCCVQGLLSFKVGIDM